MKLKSINWTSLGMMGGLIGIFGMSGCVSLGTYESQMRKCRDLVSERNKLFDDVEDLQSLRTLEKKEFEGELQNREVMITDIHKTYEDLLNALQKDIQEGNVDVSRSGDRLRIAVQNKVLFKSGSAAPQPTGKNILKKVSHVLADVTDHNIRVEGHSDNAPVKGKLTAQYPSNWELSGARAAAVIRYLESLGGIDRNLLIGVSYSDTRPLQSNSTTEGRQENRRVEITLVPLEPETQTKGIPSPKSLDKKSGKSAIDQMIADEKLAALPPAKSSVTQDETSKSSSLNQQLTSALSQAIKHKNAAVYEADGKITVSIKATALFDSGNVKLSPEGTSILQKMGPSLESHFVSQVHVEGHPGELNISNDRALSVHKYLKDTMGTSASRLFIDKPIEEGVGKSLSARRVDIILITESSSKGKLDSSPSDEAAAVESPESKRHSSKESTGHFRNPGENYELLEAEVSKRLGDDIYKQEVYVSQRGDGLTLSLKGGSLFQVGSANLSEEGIHVMSKLVDSMKGFFLPAIEIEGHPGMLDLSVQRAESVKTFIKEKGNFESKSIVVKKGSDSNDGKASRRIEIHFLKP